MDNTPIEIKSDVHQNGEILRVNAKKVATAAPLWEDLRLVRLRAGERRAGGLLPARHSDEPVFRADSTFSR